MSSNTESVYWGVKWTLPRLAGSPSSIANCRPSASVTADEKSRAELITPERADFSSVCVMSRVTISNFFERTVTRCGSSSSVACVAVSSDGTIVQGQRRWPPYRLSRDVPFPSSARL
jgi:hypothetical protein